MKAKKEQLKVALKRLNDDRDKLAEPIKWEQATNDNGALEGVIKRQRDSATKDWMVGSLYSVNMRSGISLKGSEGGIQQTRGGAQQKSGAFLLLSGFQVWYPTERIGRRNVIHCGTRRRPCKLNWYARFQRCRGGHLTAKCPRHRIPAATSQSQYGLPRIGVGGFSHASSPYLIQ